MSLTVFHYRNTVTMSTKHGYLIYWSAIWWEPVCGCVAVIKCAYSSWYACIDKPMYTYNTCSQSSYIHYTTHMFNDSTMFFFSLLFLVFFFSFTFCCCSFYLSSCLCCFIYVYVLYSYSSAYKDHLYWLISIKDVNLNAINSLAYLLLCFVFTLCFLTSFLQPWLEQWVLLKYVDRFCFWCYLLMIRTIFFLFFAQKYRPEKVVVRCLLYV